MAAVADAVAGVLEAALSSGERRNLPDSAFVFPKDKRYPIHDLSHARNALARASGKPEEGQVKAAVYKRYPQLKTQEASYGGMVKCPECGTLNVKSAAKCKNCGHDMKQVVAKAKGDGRSTVTEAVLVALEAADSLQKASTPEPFSRSRTSNWVARAGGLPAYIQHIAHDLMEKRGKSESNAIQMAIGIVENWKDGKGNVDATTRAAAAKAWAEWQALKAKAHAQESALTLVIEAELESETEEPTEEDEAAAGAAVKARRLPPRERRGKFADLATLATGKRASVEDAVKRVLVA